MLSMSLFLFSLKGLCGVFEFCISGLYWYESFFGEQEVLFLNLSFQNEIPHLTSLTCQTRRPRWKTESEKRKKKNPASVRRCLFPWQRGACACVYNDLTHAYSPRQPLLLPGCRQRVCFHTANGTVTCQARVYRRTRCAKFEKSTGESHRILISRSGLYVTAIVGTLY